MNIIYACEICSAHFSTVKEARAHEAAHFGLTADKYYAWGKLRGRAETLGKMCAGSRNRVMDTTFDEYVKALVKFEKENGLVGREPLKMCVDAADYL